MKSKPLSKKFSKMTISWEKFASILGLEAPGRHGTSHHLEHGHQLRGFGDAAARFLGRNLIICC
jgi:hypothetical protein